MFGLLTNLTKAAVSVAVTPITAAADFVTLGGVFTDRDESYTAEQLRHAHEAFNKAVSPD